MGAKYDYLSGTEEEKALGLFQLIDEKGNLSPAADTIVDKDQLLKLYRGMLRIRLIDARMIALQRQGRISFYGEALGQEASVVGTAAAMQREDYLVPALREAGAGLYRGMPLASYLSQIYGNAADVTKGRQMPCHPCDKDTNYVVMSSVVGSQIPHAVGIAWAMKISGDTGKCCFGYMGDGATSEGEFHVAINFAGVSKAPVVLVCQNNQWAISTPGSLQCAAETLAIKGLGYGVESLRVDGNDVLAVYEMSRYAAEKARRGDGPTFLELLTYRVSAHSTSDDPSRYRDEAVTDVWRNDRDPIGRVQTLLYKKGWLTDKEDQQWQADFEAEVRACIEAQEKHGEPARSTLVEDVFEDVPWHLRQQLDDLDT